MSQDALPSTFTLYAVSSDVVPSAWYSEWTMLNGDRLMGGDIPAGYTETDETTYLAALAAQASATAQRVADQDYDQRLVYSSQRRALVASGMTDEQARILIPDPNDDYTIDDF